MAILQTVVLVSKWSLPLLPLQFQLYHRHVKIQRPRDILRAGAPWPCQGKTGERIQMSRGMHAIRLIVMEFGRFMYWFYVEPTWWACSVPTLAFCHSETGGVVKGALGGAVLCYLLSVVRSQF